MRYLLYVQYSLAFPDSRDHRWPSVRYHDELSAAFALCALSCSLISRLQYRDGKNRSGCNQRKLHVYLLRDTRLRTGGIRSLCSLSALTLHTIATIPAMSPLKIAVFCFQFAGCAYQPPAGDQTSARICH